MMCLYLYNSLFQSSLPYSGMVKTAPIQREDIAQWGMDLSKSIAPYSQLFIERIVEKQPFIEMVNKKLSYLRVYDKKKLKQQFAELQTYYAAADENVSGEKGILRDNTEIRNFLADECQRILQDCPSFDNPEQANMMISAYTVFEGLLIQHDDDIIFTYDMDSEKIFAFMLKPSFPISPEEIKNTLPFQNIVEYKTYFAAYAEIIDVLFTKFYGRDYSYESIALLVEYFFDLIGCSYAMNYQKFLATLDTTATRIIAEIENFPALFEFHFLNFLSNIEHMRNSAHAFFNKDTMKTLSAVSGQYNILERHKKRRENMAGKREEFIKIIDRLWASNPYLCDHVDMLAFIKTSQNKNLRSLVQLFGNVTTKNIVMEVLQKYNAVRGLSDFAKRQRDTVIKETDRQIKNSCKVKTRIPRYAG